MAARFVRDEEAAGSNPATPTQFTGHSLPRDVAFFHAGPKRYPVTDQDGVRRPTTPDGDVLDLASRDEMYRTDPAG